ncbi:MAG TPA: hypothetical protein VEB21_01025, partial [Terriglobales bacterium]|nr:hypothetical protein [Terriglobales bacterium]
MTATTTPTSTRTPSPTPGNVALALLPAAGLSGGRACVALQLTGKGQTVAAAAVQLALPAGIALSSCTINPLIGAGTAADKELVISEPAAGARRIEVGGSPAPLGDGTLLSCQLAIDAGAAVAAYDLAAVFESWDVGGGALTTDGSDTALVVTNCNGDCDGSGAVAIGEVVRALNLFAGSP